MKFPGEMPATIGRWIEDTDRGNWFRSALAVERDPFESDEAATIAADVGRIDGNQFQFSERASHVVESDQVRIQESQSRESRIVDPAFDDQGPAHASAQYFDDTVLCPRIELSDGQPWRLFVDQGMLVGAFERCE